MNQGLTVGALASIARVSVRTLHHYDDVGVLKPVDRSDGGYRLYGTDEVERLQEILFFRELGFGLSQIAEMISSPDYERLAALRRQRVMVEKKIERLTSMVAAIDRAIDAKQKGLNMTNEEMLEVFDGFDPAEYEEEARERWGDTDAYRESARRTSQYTKNDWLVIKAEAAEINEAFLALMKAGVPPTSQDAASAVERHRVHISRWFYECGEETHAGLGQMYVADHRFTENIDKAGEGLARYMSEAIASRYKK